MAQKLDDLSLTRNESIRTPIDCVRMKRISTKDCGILEFKLCDTLMRSCKKLPTPINGNITGGVISVTTLGGEQMTRTTPAKWARYKKRSNRYKAFDELFYYVQDGYLYTLDNTYELVDLEMLTNDKSTAEEMSECDGDSSSSTSGCSKWEDEFVCPDKLLEVVMQETINEVANFYRTSIPDENPNMDEHQKSKTTN